MKVIVLLASMFLLFTTACSTTGHFKIPTDSTLKVTDRTVVQNANGEWTTSPFFWSETGGAKYRLYDKSGKLVRTGKVKTHFRVASIFWPPFAIIYWPMGFDKGEFDLTKPADGYQVVDEALPQGAGPLK